MNINPLKPQLSMKRHTVVICLLFISMMLGCSRCRKEKEVYSVPKYEKGIILTPKPGVSKDSALRYLEQVGKVLGRNFQNSIEFCLPCDSAIFIIKDLTYNDITVFANTQGSGVSKPTPPDPGATGEWGPMYYSVDFTMQVPPPSDTITQSTDNKWDGQIEEPPLNATPLIVGVLDTGVDTLFAKKYQPTSLNTCFKDGKFGWNFIGKNAQFNDDFGVGPGSGGTIHSGHGTPVSGFVVQQANGKVPIKILPVKVLNSQGTCGLFEVLCGMAYAKKAGAKIINASLGFYSSYNDGAKLFKQFIDNLTKDSVIIVAAAGNANAYEDSIAVKVTKSIAAGEERNLDKHLFFPAAFSESNPNIITVTTILHNASPKAVSPKQNFSKSKVQIGVMADETARFADPFKRPNTWEGSSFATPIATGLIASVFSSPTNYFNANGVLNRNKLFQNLQVVATAGNMSFVVNNSIDTIPRYIIAQKSRRFVLYRNLRLTNNGTAVGKP
jgi:hypothetical protein